MTRRIQKGDSVESLIMGDEPLWNINIPQTDEYLSSYIIKHTNWCNYHWDMKDYRKSVLEYIKKNKPLFNTISKKNNDNFIFREIGNYCRMITLGCPLSDKLNFLIKTKLEELYGSKPVQVVVEGKKVNIQQRIEDKTQELIGLIEEQVDHFLLNLTVGNLYKFDAQSWLVGIGVKAIHTEEIIKRIIPRERELKASLNSDKDLLEGYSFLGRAKIRRYLEFITDLLNACNTIAENKRKPRKKKKISLEKLVSKLKYLVEDPITKIKSIDPRKIISANILITYNTKTERASIFSSKSGLSIKNSSIINFDEQDSSSKHLGDKKYIFDLTRQNRDVSLFYKSIKVKEKPVRDRMNSETLILQAIKL